VNFIQPAIILPDLLELGPICGEFCTNKSREPKESLELFYQILLDSR